MRDVTPVGEVPNSVIVFSDPNLMDRIISHVTCGGSLISLAQVLGVTYQALNAFVRADQKRLAGYTQALEDRKEWAREKILQEIRDIGAYDIRQILDADGKVKPPSEWPDAVAKSISGLDISELFEGSGEERTQVGWTKKIKTVDKLKALEMAAKNLNLLTEKVEHSGKVTLDQLIMATQTRPNDSSDSNK